MKATDVFFALAASYAAIAAGAASAAITETNTPAMAAPAKNDVKHAVKPPYATRFTVTCANGACADVYYTVCFPSGVAAIGTTDAQGRTARYPTDDARPARLFPGHHRPGDGEAHGPPGIRVDREVRAVRD